jgi:phosphoribosylformylglycinamidine (FGAM) synthase-like enzyme
MAVGEALTNLVAADIATLGEVKLSANWMAAAGFPGEDARLFDTVRAVSDLCQSIGVSIPVGKDSLVDAHGLAGGRWRRRYSPETGGLAAVADRHRLRASSGCPPDADAATGTRRW